MDQDYAQLSELSAVAAKRVEAHVAAEEALAAAREKLAVAKKSLNEAADKEQRDELQPAVDEAKKRVATALAEASAADEAAHEAKEEAATCKTELLAALQRYVDKAKFEEEQLLSQRKFRSADADAAKANLDLAVRDNLPPEEQERLQAIIDEVIEGENGLNELTIRRQAATAHRDRLQSIVRAITANESQLKKEIADNQSEVERLQSAIVERRATWFTSVPPFFLGKKWLELPILDAFGSPLKIDNLWTENLKVANGSFGKVRRFDRCTTCHQGIDKTAPGSATEPAFPPEQQIEIVMETPAERPANETDSDGNPLPLTLESVYGIGLANYGLVDDDDVTVNRIVPGGFAARAGHCRCTWTTRRRWFAGR